MTSWISMLILAACVAASGNVAFAQAPNSRGAYVETGSAPISKEPDEQPTKNETPIKKDGQIYSDGSPATLEELRGRLRPIKVKDEIRLDKDGQIFLNGSLLTKEELSERLRRAKAADPSFRVAVHGDLGDLYRETIAVIDLVESVGASVAPLPSRNMIVIKKGGRIILNGETLSVDELREKLKRAKADDPSFRTDLRADGSDLSYSVVVEVLDIVNEFGGLVGLVTRPINR